MSCDGHLLNELLGTDVEFECFEMRPSWRRKLWDALSELSSTLRERRLERTVLRPALFPVKTAQFNDFSR
jgi:hypothetical protein